jgi:hypothetical protein
MRNTVPEATLVSMPRTACKLPLLVEPTQLLEPNTLAFKTRRRVQFHEARVVTFITPGSWMSKEERDDIWYQQTALDDFKCQARALCRKLRDAPDESESSRGLEHRICLERQRNKHLAIRFVLKAQARSSNPEFIATVSSKCTAWATEVALAEASRDFCEAYYPHMASNVPEVGRSLEFPFPIKKRELEEPETERRVRPRNDAI